MNELASWLSLAAICAVGAMSPGPSLAVVVRNTMVGGRGGGVRTAVAHGLGIGLYALIVALGLAVIIAESALLFRTIQYLGAAFLVYLGIRALLSSSSPLGAAEGESSGIPVRGARDGFLIAFLNPKIAIWFLALFSQFVQPDTLLWQKLLMAGLAATIDIIWYVLVAVSLSHLRVLGWLRRQGFWIDRIFGLILLAVAARVVLL